MPSFNSFTGNIRQNFMLNYSSNIMNNLVILVSFGIIIYILVQMIIVLNKPTFLYYTLSPIPTDLSITSLKTLENSNKIPEMIANEFTYSFWVYLRNISAEDGHKFLFTRTGDETDEIFTNGNPIVYFEEKTNKLIVKIKTSTTDSTNTVTPTTTISSTFHDDKCQYSELVIDYVPLKRWINVIINIDNNRATLFLDGDIYQTLLVNNPINNCGSISSSRTIEVSEGDIKIGSKDSVIKTPDALISKLQFFNYSIKTPSDIRKIYNDGPIKSQGFLQKLGIPVIGLRNPIYNVEDTCTS